MVLITTYDGTIENKGRCIDIDDVHLVDTDKTIDFLQTYLDLGPDNRKLFQETLEKDKEYVVNNKDRQLFVMILLIGMKDGLRPPVIRMYRVHGKEPGRIKGQEKLLLPMARYYKKPLGPGREEKYWWAGLLKNLINEGKVYDSGYVKEWKDWKEWKKGQST